MWQSVCAGISRADFWALLGKLAIEAAEPSGFIDSFLEFRFGRKDSVQCSNGADRLPDAELSGEASLRSFFADKLGLTISDGVALIGAHTVGRVHPNRSGYGNNNGGPQAWVNQPHVFDNDYFRTLVRQRWNHRNAPGGSGREQWNRQNRIMLNSDMGIAFEIGADDGTANENNCGGNNNNNNNNNNECQPFPTTRPQVDAYINDNSLFLRDFAFAYNKLTTVGYGGNLSPTGNSPDVRLGTLAIFDHLQCTATIQVNTEAVEPQQPPDQAQPIEDAPTQTTPLNQGNDGNNGNGRGQRPVLIPQNLALVTFEVGAQALIAQTDVVGDQVTGLPVDGTSEKYDDENEDWVIIVVYILGCVVGIFILTLIFWFLSCFCGRSSASIHDQVGNRSSNSKIPPSVITGTPTNFNRATIDMMSPRRAQIGLASVTVPHRETNDANTSGSTNAKNETFYPAHTGSLQDSTPVSYPNVASNQI